MKQATKQVIYSIMRRKREWKPYEVINKLQAMDIFISESTLTRQYRRWNADIIAIPPKPGPYRTWTYKLREGV
jgi:hypothetical protein